MTSRTNIPRVRGESVHPKEVMEGSAKLRHKTLRAVYGDMKKIRL